MKVSVYYSAEKSSKENQKYMKNILISSKYKTFFTSLEKSRVNSGDKAFNTFSQISM